MVADGVGDGVALALRAGVIAAHDTLQFREFTHHAGDKIRLTQTRRAFGGVCSRARNDAFGYQPTRKLCHALYLIGNAAQFLMKRNLRQFLRLGIQRDL